MPEPSAKSAGASAIPDDDSRRGLVVARPDTDATLEHVALVGDTYTILLRSEDTEIPGGGCTRAMQRGRAITL